jgi:hypothetical protein
LKSRKEGVKEIEIAREIENQGIAMKQILLNQIEMISTQFLLILINY